jgi:hypothetical protein
MGEHRFTESGHFAAGGKNGLFGPLPGRDAGLQASGFGLLRASVGTDSQQVAENRPANASSWFYQAEQTEA